MPVLTAPRQNRKRRDTADTSLGSVLLNNRLMVAGAAFAGMVHRHPKRVSAMVAAFLLCGGGGAYAVASFGPDPSNLPVTQVLLAVQPLAAPPAEQAAALDEHHFRLYTSGTTRASDTASSLLQRLSLIHI